MQLSLQYFVLRSEWYIRFYAFVTDKDPKCRHQTNSRSLPQMQTMQKEIVRHMMREFLLDVLLPC